MNIYGEKSQSSLNMVVNRSDYKRRRKDEPDVLPESPKRTKVHAQRKFAQGSSSSVTSPTLTPVKDKVKVNGSAPPAELLPAKRPHTEDFLTFLCFRGTRILPERLNFFNTASVPESLDDEAGTSSNAKQKKNSDQGPSTSDVDHGRNKAKPASAQDRAAKALRKKYQEQRLAKQKKTCLTKLTTKTDQCSQLKTKTTLKQKHMRVGLRSGGQLPPGSDLGLKNPVRKSKTALPSKKDPTPSEKNEKQSRSPLRRTVRGNSKQIASPLSDFSSEDEQPLVKKKTVPQGRQQAKAKSPTATVRERLSRSRPQHATASTSGVTNRPSRKTKEAAALYMEMLGKDLRSPDEEFEDDEVSVESFPELPNKKKTELRERELKALVDKSSNSTKEETKGRKAMKPTAATPRAQKVIAKRVLSSKIDERNRRLQLRNKAKGKHLQERKKKEALRKRRVILLARAAKQRAGKVYKERSSSEVESSSPSKSSSPVRGVESRRSSLTLKQAAEALKQAAEKLADLSPRKLSSSPEKSPVRASPEKSVPKKRLQFSPERSLARRVASEKKTAKNVGEKAQPASQQKKTTGKNTTKTETDSSQKNVKDNQPSTSSQRKQSIDEKLTSQRKQSIDEKLTSQRKQSIDEKLTSQRKQSIDEKLTSLRKQSIDEKLTSQKKQPVEKSVNDKKPVDRKASNAAKSLEKEEVEQPSSSGKKSAVNASKNVSKSSAVSKEKKATVVKDEEKNDHFGESDEEPLTKLTKRMNKKEEEPKKIDKKEEESVTATKKVNKKEEESVTATKKVNKKEEESVAATKKVNKKEEETVEATKIAAPPVKTETSSDKSDSQVKPPKQRKQKSPQKKLVDTITDKTSAFVGTRVVSTESKPQSQTSGIDKKEMRSSVEGSCKTIAVENKKDENKNEKPTKDDKLVKVSNVEVVQDKSGMNEVKKEESKDILSGVGKVESKPSNITVGNVEVLSVKTEKPTLPSQSSKQTGKIINQQQSSSKSSGNVKESPAQSSLNNSSKGGSNEVIKQSETKVQNQKLSGTDGEASTSSTQFVDTSQKKLKIEKNSSFDEVATDKTKQVKKETVQSLKRVKLEKSSSLEEADMNNKSFKESSLDTKQVKTEKNTVVDKSAVDKTVPLQGMKTMKAEKSLKSEELPVKKIEPAHSATLLKTEKITSTCTEPKTNKTSSWAAQSISDAKFEANLKHSASFNDPTSSKKTTDSVSFVPLRMPTIPRGKEEPSSLYAGSSEKVNQTQNSPLFASRNTHVTEAANMIEAATSKPREDLNSFSAAFKNTSMAVPKTKPGKEDRSSCKPGLNPEDSRSNSKPGSNPEDSRSNSRLGLNPEDRRSNSRLGLNSEDGRSNSRLGLNPEDRRSNSRLGLNSEDGRSNSRLGLNSEDGRSNSRLGLNPEDSTRSNNGRQTVNPDVKCSMRDVSQNKTILSVPKINLDRSTAGVLDKGKKVVPSVDVKVGSSGLWSGVPEKNSRPESSKLFIGEQMKDVPSPVKTPVKLTHALPAVSPVNPQNTMKPIARPSVEVKKTKSVNDTWRQAFKNAKIPKPGQSSPVMTDDKPFVRKPFTSHAMKKQIQLDGKGGGGVTSTGTQSGEVAGGSMNLITPFAVNRKPFAVSSSTTVTPSNVASGSPANVNSGLAATNVSQPVIPVVTVTMSTKDKVVNIPIPAATSEDAARAERTIDPDELRLKEAEFVEDIVRMFGAEKNMSIGKNSDVSPLPAQILPQTAFNSSTTTERGKQIITFTTKVDNLEPPPLSPVVKNVVEKVSTPSRTLPESSNDVSTSMASPAITLDDNKSKVPGKRNDISPCMSPAKPASPMLDDKPKGPGKHHNLPLPVEQTLKTKSLVTKKPPPLQKPFQDLRKQQQTVDKNVSLTSSRTMDSNVSPFMSDFPSSSGVLNKKKVNMSTEEIKKWLNDSTSTGIEHTKDCGIFEKNQCECGPSFGEDKTSPLTSEPSSPLTTEDPNKSLKVSEPKVIPTGGMEPGPSKVNNINTAVNKQVEKTTSVEPSAVESKMTSNVFKRQQQTSSPQTGFKAVEPTQTRLGKSVDSSQTGFGKSVEPSQSGFGKSVEPTQTGFGKSVEPTQTGVGKSFEPSQTGFVKTMDSPQKSSPVELKSAFVGGSLVSNRTKFGAVDRTPTKEDDRLKVSVDGRTKSDAQSPNAQFSPPMAVAQFQHRDETSSNDESPEKSSSSSVQHERRSIFHQKRSVFRSRPSLSRSPSAFSPENESSVYAFEPDLPPTSTPFRASRAKGHKEGRASNATTDDEDAGLSSNSIAVQVNIDSEEVLECSTQTDDDDGEGGGGGGVFYIPLQRGAGGGDLGAEGGGGSGHQVIQGVAVKLGTEGPDQRVIMSAKLVTKPRSTFAATSTPRPLIGRGESMGKPEQKVKPLTMHAVKPPVGTVQPTARVTTVQTDAKPPMDTVKKIDKEIPAADFDRPSKPAADKSTDCAVTRNSTTAAAKNSTTASKNSTTASKNSPTSAADRDKGSQRSRSSSRSRSPSPSPLPRRKAAVTSAFLSATSAERSRAGRKQSPAPFLSKKSRKSSPSLKDDGQMAGPSGKGKRSKGKGGAAPDNASTQFGANLEEAPVFYPTEKEFLDPLEYIEKIRPVAEKFGICKVIPPADFKPECKVSDDMRFTAYNQYVHKMQQRWGPNVKEMLAIRRHLATQSISMSQPPWIGGMEVDLPRLYQTVQNCGGLKEVMEKKRWTRVADAMRIPKFAQDRVTKLDDIYCKFLLPYDTLSHDERTRLFQQVELEWERRMLRNDSYYDDDDEDDDSSDSDDSCNLEECIVKGKTMALSAFYRVARNTMAVHFPKNDSPSAGEVEAEFWGHVASRQSHVCVHSGSIDSGPHGYGFPIVKNSATSKHPWNLKVLTNNAGTILRSLGPLMGVTVPTLHVGMVFTTCCWYRDPHGLPWIEYLHTGKSKIWYGIPDSSSAAFRLAMEECVPRLCRRDQRLWLASDTAMVSPHLLAARGVRLCRTVQQPGQFIVVFPKAFTSSVCTGYLVSESVYFAQPSWLATAHAVFKDISDSSEPSMFSLERLLFSIASDARSHLDVLSQVLPMVEEIKESELNQRFELEKLGLTQTERIHLSKARGKSRLAHDEDGDYECDTCRANLFLSLVKNTHEDNVYCLKHAIEHLKEKHGDLKHYSLLYTYNGEEFDELIEKIKTRIEQKSQKKQQGKPSSAAGSSSSKHDQH
ncbi:uncharacterized protein LOC111052838 [Nilaparvata lugens]|uniref:uncharacterized protein LOC111052838 n=1 Tax=Nilaparvata lugens TaxID=108931 RepID=UPI00193C8F67|nr:uncharacterized protein LOC111052838 [Nilaparvata lugens]